MLRSLALTVEDVGRNRSRTSMSNLDTKVSRLGHASWATEGPTEHVAAVVEDNVEYDPDNLRSGLHRGGPEALHREPAQDQTAGVMLARSTAIVTDSQDRVYLFNRSDHPLIVLDRDGNYLNSWGEGVLTDAHGMFID